MKRFGGLVSVFVLLIGTESTLVTPHASADDYETTATTAYREASVLVSGSVDGIAGAGSVYGISQLLGAGGNGGYIGAFVVAPSPATFSLTNLALQTPAFTLSVPSAVATGPFDLPVPGIGDPIICEAVVSNYSVGVPSISGTLQPFALILDAAVVLSVAYDYQITCAGQALASGSVSRNIAFPTYRVSVDDALFPALRFRGVQYDAVVYNAEAHFAGSLDGHAVDLTFHIQTGHLVDFETGVQPGLDSDVDGLADANDNCPSDPNPGQEDVDLDLMGDVCDPFPNDPDNEQAQCEADVATCTLDLAECMSNVGGSDSDSDGEYDLTDRCPDTPSVDTQNRPLMDV